MYDRSTGPEENINRLIFWFGCARGHVGAYMCGGSDGGGGPPPAMTTTTATTMTTTTAPTAPPAPPADHGHAIEHTSTQAMVCGDESLRGVVPLGGGGAPGGPRGVHPF